MSGGSEMEMSEKKKALTLVLIFGLVVSFIVNAVVLIENQGLQRSNDELHNSLLDLRSSYEKLNRTCQWLNQNYVELKGVYLELFDDTFSPPISKLQAIEIALKHGGWNITNLKGMLVTATLEYRMFQAPHPIVVKVEKLEVKEPVFDFTPVVDGNTTYRYIWHVIIMKIGPIRSIPPAGFYFIDAVTGEIIPHGDL